MIPSDPYILLSGSVRHGSPARPLTPREQAVLLAGVMSTDERDRRSAELTLIAAYDQSLRRVVWYAARYINDDHVQTAHLAALYALRQLASGSVIFVSGSIMSTYDRQLDVYPSDMYVRLSSAVRMGIREERLSYERDAVSRRIDSPVEDCIPTNAFATSEGEHEVDARLTVETVLSFLTARDADIVRRAFALHPYRQEQTPEIIANAVHLSPRQVRNILQASLLRMKNSC